MTSTRGQALVVGLHALLGLSVLVSATVLTGLHDPIGPELATLFGAIIGLAGGGAAAVSTLGTAINGKSVVSPAVIADLQQVLRETVDHLAGARAQLPSSAPAFPAEPPPAQPPPAQPPPL